MTTENLYQSPDSEVLVTDDAVQIPKFFSAKQRIGRIRYLAYSGGIYLLFVLTIGIITGIYGLIIGFHSEVPSNPAMNLVIIICYLFMFAGLVVVIVRRLHDLGKSGLLFFFMLLPIANVFFALYLIFGKGTPGSNEYGPQPAPNTAGTWIAGLTLPTIFIIGILAAIALPAYQNYTERAKQAQMK